MIGAATHIVPLPHSPLSSSPGDPCLQAHRVECVPGVQRKHGMFRHLGVWVGLDAARLVCSASVARRAESGTSLVLG